jgi:hypothetical protein
MSTKFHFLKQRERFYHKIEFETIFHKNRSNSPQNMTYYSEWKNTPDRGSFQILKKKKSVKIKFDLNSATLPVTLAQRCAWQTFIGIATTWALCIWLQQTAKRFKVESTLEFVCIFLQLRSVGESTCSSGNNQLGRPFY